MVPAAKPQASVSFGRFRVLPHRREILADGQPLKLGGRAFDLLLALIEANGAVVSKDALMARVWPNQIVEENNLQAQISALRAALGEERGLIRTVSGRGYQFAGKIRVLSANQEQDAVAIMHAEDSGDISPTNLPQVASELIGRDDQLREVVGLAATHRLVTLTGVGGIGKTRLALAAARQLLPQFADGVWVAKLAPLFDANLVPAAVAAAVGLELPSGAVSPDRVARALGGKKLLLVLANCEHVVGTAALMAEALLRCNSAAHVIATSREPLAAEGERIYPVPPLAVPSEDADEAEDPSQYGAVRLFFARARATDPHFEPDRRTAAMIAAICRRLDGIPLAIELAAARAATLGIEGLAARLDDRFQLLTGGRRTALPRHQTLRATLDWSYALLAEPERVVLRRLAVFAGAFSLEVASAVVASQEIAPSQVVDCLFDLTTKSLVAAERDTTIGRYRFLETTRAYALEKLAKSGELKRVARRHAEFYRDLFERAEAERETRPQVEWLAARGHQIDDVRAALDWAFSSDGDPSIGVALTASTVPLWLDLGLLEECSFHVERALTALTQEAARDARREMKLLAARGGLRILTKMATGAEIGEAFTRVLEIAEELGDTLFRLRALWGLWFFHTASRRHRVALQVAESFCAVAANWTEPDDRLLGQRMIGVSWYFLGDMLKARHHLECVLADHVTLDHRSIIIRYQLDLRVMVRLFLARILWLQGFPDQAMRAAERTVQDAYAANHALSLCYALALGACPIALMVEDLAAAEHYIDLLLEHSTRHSLPRWQAFGRCHQGALAIKRGDFTKGLQLVRAGFNELGDAWAALPFIAYLMTETFGHAGYVSEGLTVVDEAIEQSEQTEERWQIAELLRIKGELLLLQDAPAAAALAEDHFRQAIDWARRDGTLAWELRAATSLARLLSAHGRRSEGNAVLAPVYDRFTEGLEAADLKAAKALLEALQ
jgi:predicted ATPase/DNA-binding winged helix-turn-helix (wHTH) protein